MKKLPHLTLLEARSMIAKGDLCPVEYVEALLRHINGLNAAIGAFLSVDYERALAAAHERRRAWRRDDVAPLFGIPFAVKDIIDVEGSPTSCQSRASSPAPAVRTAACVERLTAAGGIYLGKVALYEFALGGPDFEAPWPPARNPWNRDYMPGSSSTGSGAAVAARMVPLAVGTDTGGSVRSPAAMNGIVGLKPGFGMIPTAGLFPLAPSMDTVGPMARSVADVALAFECMAAAGGGAPVQPERPRVGLVNHLWREDVEPAEDVAAAIDRAVLDLCAAGCTFMERRLAPLRTINAVGWTTLYAEAYELHRARLNDLPERYGSSTRDLLLTGACFSAGDYVRAQRLRREIEHLVDEALTGTDCLLTAVSARPACRLDDRAALDALAKASVRILCNVTGHPALALPVGRCRNGLPIGIQLIGRKGGERQLLQAGTWIERHLTGWSQDWVPALAA